MMVMTMMMMMTIMETMGIMGETRVEVPVEETKIQLNHPPKMNNPHKTNSNNSKKTKQKVLVLLSMLVLELLCLLLEYFFNYLGNCVAYSEEKKILHRCPRYVCSAFDFILLI